MVIMAPANENECRQMLYTGYSHTGPAAVRYPRGTGPGVAIDSEMKALPIGRAHRVRKGNQQVAFLSFGALLDHVLLAAEKFDATVVDMRFIKPIDSDMIAKMAQSHDLLVTVEDNVVSGGAGSAVNEVLQQLKITIPVLNLGLPDYFQEHGSREEVLAEASLDSEGIRKQVKQFTQSTDKSGKLLYLQSQKK